jgi:GTP-binding protein EngB required for normal cell division
LPVTSSGPSGDQRDQETGAVKITAQQHGTRVSSANAPDTLGWRTAAQAKQFIDHSIEQLLQLVRQHQLDSDGELGRRLQVLRDYAAQRNITVVVLGEFGSGKSTFINTLLGMDILPTSLLPANAVCTYISYGSAPVCRVKLLAGQEILVSVLSIKDYIAGNHSEEVASVHLRLPVALLSTGMTIVDSPGFNEKADKHGAQIAKAVESADACIFVMHGDEAASNTSVDFLRKIQLNIGKFFFVINQADYLNSADQSEVAEYVRKHLIEDCGFPNPRVVLISSNPEKIRSSNVWEASFESFKNDLRRFMDAEADLVVARALAPLIEDVIVRADALLTSKSRLAERELAAHYRASIPDSTTLIQGLRAEIRSRTEDEVRVMEGKYAKHRIRVFSDLRFGVKEAIWSAHSKEELQAQVSQIIVREFRDHEEKLRTLLEEEFRAAYRKRQDEIEETFRQLFTGVRLLEFRTFFSFRTSIIAILTGALALPSIERLTDASQHALMVSPVLGACLGIVLYGWYFWRKSQIPFQPATQDPIVSIAPGELVESLAKIGKGFWAELFELLGFTSLEDLKRKYQEKTRPALQRFAVESKAGGERQIRRLENKLCGVLQETVERRAERYENILNELIKHQTQIASALEKRRGELRSDRELLSSMSSKLPEAQRDLELQLKGFSSGMEGRSSLLLRTELRGNEPRSTEVREIPPHAVRLVSTSEVSLWGRLLNPLVLVWFTALILAGALSVWSFATTTTSSVADLPASVTPTKPSPQTKRIPSLRQLEQTKPAAPPAKPLTPSGRILDERKFGDYTIRISLEGEDTEEKPSLLEIFKRGTRVYVSKNHSITIADMHEDGGMYKDAPPVGAYITGLPDLVVREHSAGMQCCTSITVLELGDSVFRKAATLEQGEWTEGGFKRQNDGEYLFYGWDPAVRMKGAAFADSVAPEVILRYSNGSFHLAADLMRKPPPSVEELNAKAGEIASNFIWSTQDTPGAFWQYVLDLTYSGNSHSADEFVALAWPTQRTDKAERMQEFLEKLKKSPYWADLQALNTGQ